MRARQSRLELCMLRKVIPNKDNEGNSYVEWGEPKPFKAIIWPASGKLQSEMYGQRLNYIKSCRVEGKYNIVLEGKRTIYKLEDKLSFCEGDGICLYSSEGPDYRIIAIKPYPLLYFEMERI